MRPYIKSSEFDTSLYEKFGYLKRNVGNNGGKSRYTYVNAVCAFDIETAYFEEIEQSAMYIWQMSLENEIVIIGRTWKEFQELIKKIDKELCERNLYLVVYVHNLSFEFQFLSGIYKFSENDVFCVKSRKILTARMSHIEFRCSAIHTNMSLELFVEKMGVEEKKLVGKLDYSVRRFPTTELSDSEMEYCIRDVTSLVSALKIEMAADGDNLYTIPLTSTGYVRRDMKQALRKMPPEYIKSLLQSYDIYEMEREAFMGGIAHANRFFVGKIVENVDSYDRQSSYPDVQCNDMFPVEPFKKIGYVTPDVAEEYLCKGKYAMLIRMSIKNLRLADYYDPLPYIPLSKCRKFDKASMVTDNGRVMSCNYLEVTFTDVDIRIFNRHYIADDVCYYDVAISRYGKLPGPVVDVIHEYFDKKTALKGVKGEEVMYVKSKNKINACFGMSAQDPGKGRVLYIEGEYKDDLREVCEIMGEFNRKRAVMPYAWGVWTTAHARNRLMEGAELVGDRFVYCDTDSVKYIKDDIEDLWEAYNNKRIAASTESESYAVDKKGNVQYMGIYEHEGTYEKFITYGAKKYAYIQNGELHVTIAGVTKNPKIPEKDGAHELERSGGIEALQLGFTFKDAGGLDAKYVDDVEPYVYHAPEGEDIVITKNVSLLPDTYTLSLEKDYEKLVEMCENYIDYLL